MNFGGVPDSHASGAGRAAATALKLATRLGADGGWRQPKVILQSAPRGIRYATTHKEDRMKAVLASIAALGLSVSAASACNYHQSMASSQVDTIKTASVEKSDMTKATPPQQIIKKETPPPKSD
ncbi:hypothetical protein [Mesorhizobium sp.]|uniref:hypothetical protein n=1 Tax=Mesorhizobium sp. TaxID=1871066 RepID=UPI0025F15FA9|nr:hypothetical protein [Mesorhizobium sp.]